MADKFLDISFLGDKELSRKLARLELKVQRKIVKDAMRAAAEPVLQAAKALAPVLTGKMRDSLRIRVLAGRHMASGKLRGIAGAVVETGKRSQLGIAEDDPYFYPAVVEYRHKSFLRAGLDQARGQAFATAAREIRAGILREVGA